MIRIISLVGIVISLAIGFSLLGVPGAQAMLFAILLIAYALPAIVAWSRQHPSRDSVVLLNLFLGWTFLGWLIALLWATSRPVPQRPVAGLKQERSV